MRGRAGVGDCSASRTGRLDPGDRVMRIDRRRRGVDYGHIEGGRHDRGVAVRVGRVASDRVGAERKGRTRQRRAHGGAGAIDEVMRGRAVVGDCSASRTGRLDAEDRGVRVDRRWRGVDHRHIEGGRRDRAVAARVGRIAGHRVGAEREGRTGQRRAHSGANTIDEVMRGRTHVVDDRASRAGGFDTGDGGVRIDRRRRLVLHGDQAVGLADIAGGVLGGPVDGRGAEREGGRAIVDDRHHTNGVCGSRGSEGDHG